MRAFGILLVVFGVFVLVVMGLAMARGKRVSQPTPTLWGCEAIVLGAGAWMVLKRR